MANQKVGQNANQNSDKKADKLQHNGKTISKPNLKIWDIHSVHIKKQTKVKPKFGTKC